MPVEKIVATDYGADVFLAPMGAVRMNRSDAWRKRPEVEKYMDWKRDLRMAFSHPTMSEVRDLLEEGSLMCIFHLPPPATIQKKKVIHVNAFGMRASLSKPDIDNMIKAVLDSFFSDDIGDWPKNAKDSWLHRAMYALFKSPPDNFGYKAGDERVWKVMAVKRYAEQPRISFFVNTHYFIAEIGETL